MNKNCEKEKKGGGQICVIQGNLKFPWGQPTLSLNENAVCHR